MKKKFLLFLICVAIAATSLIALVACKDEEEQGTVPDGNPAAFYNELVKANDVTISNYNAKGELINVKSLNERGEFINYSDILTNNKLAKYDGSDLWLYKDFDGDKIWTKAKIDKSNEFYTNSIAEIKTVISLLSSVGTIKESQFEEIDGLWFVKGASNASPKVGLKAINNTLEGYIENNGKMHRDYVIELISSITLPSSAEYAAAVSVDNLSGFANPLSYLETFFSAENVTVTMYELETSVTMGFNANGEFNDGETIAKYSGSDLWAYTNNDTSSWVKSKVEKDNQKYLNKLQAIKEVLRDLSEDFADEEYTYDQEDGCWYDNDYNTAIELEDNTLSFWVYDTEIKDYDLYYELTLGSNLTLPEGAENAVEVEKELILGYDNPFDHINAMLDADNFTIRFNNGEYWEYYALNTKGEFRANDIVGIFVGEEFWVYANDGRKALVEFNGSNYKMIINAIRKEQLNTCTLPEGTTKEDFVKVDNRWNFEDFSLEMTGTTLDIYEKGVGWSMGAMSLKTYIGVYADHDDYVTVSEEEIFEF